ncbi:MAG: heme ABC exporter, ATP-binding protein CcmA [Deltaproteobacteria bacterium RIFCSPLOWO2_12_FULL_40_28]|nr:MAG: heme ABC exporter, ATP-binding protein CcmA [Deltaproteobacteria bacterium RIFCSPHIGHO2_02_FULL_40_28]OGQ20832.1 MAG: heme ABC exporter, ATP-binding protein CcmA [Deltaproteobacteria bacterium RIFCSPHIGHO2_12_FULL_40_32]OGQ39233.1 MAG: heme ABC exporter, ATP-binding protein CcmA [Deltaproteobacteria bacterium RIFCSPLOWO2_02_FULL_40_36]OGQ54514.1 MAG: heme ABC exporter, ATP-binding protein CcmA [Deltaproteobacteria bacterium RIFCSPLOWO2_12_FULL_40_28]
MMNAWKLKILSLSFQYDSHHIFSNLSWEILNGSLLVLKGSNGIGKSTLLKLIAGLLKPSDGFVSFDSYQPKLAYYSGLPGLYLDLTALDNLNYFSSLENKAPEYLKQIITDFNLGAFFERPIRHLSQGEKARCALASLFLSDADFFILDEPLNTLDVSFRKKFIGYLQEQVSQQKTILMTTHSLEGLDGISCFQLTNSGITKC